MKYISAGSADRTTNIWEVSTGVLKHRLGGHTGSVNETALHPSGTIIASASSDRTIWLGEIGASSDSGVPDLQKREGQQTKKSANMQLQLNITYEAN